MNTITIDFAFIKSVDQLHGYLKEIFHLPDYYGCNMDALWDCLQCGFEEETRIILKNVSAFPENRRFEIDALICVFMDLKKVGDIADVVLVDDDTPGCNHANISW